MDYYSNRFIVTADGNVRVRLSDGTIVRGETFAMDLKLNRYVVAGNVRLDNRTIHEEGAAFAGFLDLDRSYLLTATGVPDRYTYFGLDWSDPHKGRDQPGDAYALPNIDDRPFVIARRASIVPRTSIDLKELRIYVYGAWVPLPAYVVNFSANPNFAQNGFSGAVGDVGLPFYGTATSLTSAHLRYDQYRGLYLSFDQHFVWNRDYVVASVNPLTQEQRQWNFIGYKRESNDFETRLFYQLSLGSKGVFSEPYSASSFANFAANTAYDRHAFGLSIDQWNNDLLGGAVNGYTPYGLNQAGHPMDMQLSVQSYEDEWRVGRYLHVPLKFQYRFGFGYYHDAYGIPTVNYTEEAVSTAPPEWGGVEYQTIWQHFLGVTMYTPAITIARNTTIALKADKQRQWYSLPHYVDTTNTSITLARTPIDIKRPAFYFSYGVLNVGDYYGADQLIAYPPYGCPTACGIAVTPFGTYSGLDAFRGIATSRNWTGSVVWTPTQYFAFNAQLRRFYDTPAPVPGLGGQPPWQLALDVRVRLAKTILMDVYRSYYFNFGNNVWSPTTGIQFSP